MLAYFDCKIDAGEFGAISGMCKISKPKEGQARSQYFSIFL